MLLALLRLTGRPLTSLARENKAILGRNLMLSASIRTSDKEPPSIPPFIEKFDEPLKDKKARLLYQSRKRGILENGLLLATFAHKYLDTFSEEQLALYDRLINLPSNDWEIYYWATGVRETPEEFDTDIMKLLKEHAKNEDRESRFHLPALKQTE